MNVPLWVIVTVSAVTDFTLGFTATMTGAMVANGAVSWPTPATWLFAVLIGLGAAGKEVRSQFHLVEPPK